MARTLTQLETDRQTILEEMVTLAKQPGVDSADGTRVNYQQKLAVLEKSLKAIETQIQRLKGPSKILIEGIDN